MTDLNVPRTAHSGFVVMSLVCVLACAALAGCVSDRDWRAAHQVTPGNLATERTLSTAQINDDAWPQDYWWQGYGDPQLNTLMSDAVGGSPSLQMAQARLRAAQAQATRASGARLPSTSLDAEVNRQRYSANGLYPAPFAGNYATDGQIALDFSYDLDFWGRNREVLESARASVHAAEADREAARLALTVAVARAYFQLNLQFALLDIANDSLEQQNTILKLTQQLASKGLENIARVKQSEGTVALTRVAVEYEEASIKLIKAQLGALVGAGPDRGLDLTRPHLAGPRKIELPGALPANLLGRRPDIVAEKWRVEAATHGISTAEAAFYPNINLTAFAGFQSIGLATLFNGGSAIVGAGPALSLPLFNRRELRGQLQAQQAQYDLSVAQYNQTLIDAVNDVANVVTNWDALVRESDEARTAEDAAQMAYAISKDRYRAGLDNYLTVLTAENEVFLTQAIRVQLVARELNLTADLVRALGGGYSTSAPAGN
jgi:NodT family efflux transporter outer membrane factor (OMF) lipoprotein